MGARLTLTVEEAARLLGVGRNTAYDAVRAGDIPSVRIGRRVLIPRGALLALVGTSGEKGAPTHREGPAANGALSKNAEATARDGS